MQNLQSLIAMHMATSRNEVYVEIKKQLKDLITTDDLFFKPNPDNMEYLTVIKEYMETDNSGDLKKTDVNLRLLFECDPVLSTCCFYDTSCGKVYTRKNYRPFGEIGSTRDNIDGLRELVSDIWDYLIDHYGFSWSNNVLEQRIWKVAIGRSINCIDAYLDWILETNYTANMENPLDELMEYIDLSSESYEYTEDNEKGYKNYVRSVLDLWYKKLCNINAISYKKLENQIDYAMDVVPIFIGWQAAKKSTFISKMCGSDLRYFGKQESLNVIGQKDELAKLAGKLVCEIMELGGSNFKDMNRIKGFVSQTVYEIRLPYDRSPVKLYRRWGGIATSNNREGLLTDETGNRRWFPIHVNSLDVESIDKKNICGRLLAYYWQRAKKKVDTLGLEEYKAFLYKQLKDIYSGEFSIAAEIQQDTACFIPDYAFTVIAFLRDNTKYLLTKEDIFYYTFPDAKGSFHTARFFKSFNAYVSKILTNEGFVPKMITYYGKPIRCWMHNSMQDKTKSGKAEWYKEARETNRDMPWC